jgi:hypothetical protein
MHLAVAKHPPAAEDAGNSDGITATLRRRTFSVGLKEIGDRH